VLTVSVAEPVPLATVIAPILHVAAGFTTGETLQPRVTVEGSRPPEGVIVTVACAELPGTTDPRDEPGNDRLNDEVVTTTVDVLDVLPLKFESPA
jgi:hypothetical protein